MFHPALIGLMAVSGGVPNVPERRLGIGPWSPRRGLSFQRKQNNPAKSPEDEEALLRAQLKRERRAALRSSQSGSLNEKG